MKDNAARALAIVALVFMGLFLAALIATVVDRNIFNGGIGYVALGCGVMTLMIFFALKADGRGFSITKMNNDIEMEKITKALEEQERKEAEAAKAAAEEQTADADGQTEDGESDGAESDGGGDSGGV